MRVRFESRRCCHASKYRFNIFRSFPAVRFRGPWRSRYSAVSSPHVGSCRRSRRSWAGSLPSKMAATSHAPFDVLGRPCKPHMRQSLRNAAVSEPLLDNKGLLPELPPLSLPQSGTNRCLINRGGVSLREAQRELRKWLTDERRQQALAKFRLQDNMLLFTDYLKHYIERYLPANAERTITSEPELIASRGQGLPRGPT